MTIVPKRFIKIKVNGNIDKKGVSGTKTNQNGFRRSRKKKTGENENRLSLLKRFAVKEG